MKIIILGAGQVGRSVAESLAGEANDITVIDTDPERLRLLQDRYDLRTVVGNAAHPSVLASAGADDADLLLAVTHSDEINMLACKLAQVLFNTPTRVARIRDHDYLSRPELLSEANLAVDHAICPEQLVTDYIGKLLEFPEALQVLDFACGKVRLVAVRAYSDGLLVGHPLTELKRHIPEVDCRVAAIFRRDRPIIPTGDTVIEAGDEVFFIAAADQIRTVLRELRRMDKPVRRVMVAGGGNIGRRLAAGLEQDYQLKLIESDRRHCERLAAQMSRCLVLHGDCTDEELLEQENVEDMDVFCALTDDDEDNILAALLAKRMGARRVIALINRSVYVDLMQGSQIDIAISPVQITIGSLLAHIRRGDVAAVHSLRRGAAEVLEAVVHGDAKTSRLVSRCIDEIPLPRGATIGAVVRNDQVLMAHHDIVIESGDHLIVFVTSRHLIPKVESLFQVGLGFF